MEDKLPQELYKERENRVNKMGNSKERMFLSRAVLKLAP